MKTSISFISSMTTTITGESIHQQHEQYEPVLLDVIILKYL